MINVKKYISYLKYDIVSGFLGTVIWVSLSTFTITTKSMLDVDSITVLEAMVFMCSMIGVYIAYSHLLNLKYLLLIDILFETLFLMSILYLVYIDSKYIAIAIYSVVILGRIITPGIQEKHRKYQDANLKFNSNKRLLSLIRKKDSYFGTIAGVLGSLVAIFVVTVLKVDLYAFAICMLVLGVIQNTYDYYKWIKFIK